MMARRKLTAIALGLCAGPVIGITSASGSMMMILMAIVGLGLAIAIVTHPAIGFLATAFMIPLERFGRITSDSSSFTISIMRLVGVLAIGSWLFHILLKKQQFRLGTACWLYLGYVAVAFASVLYSTDVAGTTRACGQLLSNVLFFVVVIGVCSSFRMIKLGTVLWLAATVAIGLFAIYDWHFSGKTIVIEDSGLTTNERFRTVAIDNSEWESGMTGLRRSIGSSSHYASYGINLIVTIPFLFFYLRRRPSWFVTAMLWLCLLVVSYNIMLTNTRAVFAFFVVTVVLCVAWGLAEVKLPAVLAAVLGVAVVIPFIRADIYERILDPAMYTAKGSSTLRIRLVYWRAGWEVVRDHWFLGTGMGNELEIPKRSSEQWTPKRTSVHNVFLNTLIEVGVVGFALFFSFIGLLLYDSSQTARLLRKHRREEAYWYMVACQIAMVAVLLFGLQCEVYSFPLKGWWYVAGATVVMQRIAVRLAQRPPDDMSLSDEVLLRAT